MGKRIHSLVPFGRGYCFYEVEKLKVALPASTYTVMASMPYFLGVERTGVLVVAGKTTVLPLTEVVGQASLL